MLGLILAGDRGLHAASTAHSERIALDHTRLVALINDPSNIIAIGLNYSDYASEAELSAPARQLCFAKHRSSIVGPRAEVLRSSQ